MSTTLRVTPADFAPPAVLDRWRQVSTIAGILALVGSIIGAFLEPDHFLRCWLLAFMFWLGPTLGSLVLLMIQYTSGGNWGRLGRRFWEAASGWPLFLMFLFWLPIAIGMKRLYPWTSMDIADLGASKAAYDLNGPLFILRGIVYFAGWSSLAWFLRRWSRTEEAGLSTPEAFVKVQNASGAGIVFYGLTITFASIDWVMSLSPQWWSTIFGMLFMVGQVLSALAFTILLLVKLSSTSPVSRAFRTDHLHDFGKLMFAFVILWAYLSFAQWLIIWSGNLVEEIRWYIDRIRGGWQTIAVMLIVLHFVVPFALLLSRSLKRHRKRLVAVAIGLLCMRYLDLLWLIVPNFHQGVSGFDLAMFIVNPIAIGGLWLGLFLRQLGRRALMPVNDPHFVEMLEAKHG